MNTARLTLVVLAALCCVAQTSQPDALKARIKKDVEDLNNAIIKEDFAKVADLTLPNIILLAGGRDKMIATMTAGNAKFKADGIVFSAMTVHDPEDPVAVLDERYVVVTYQLEMKAPGLTMSQPTFVIGFSDDQGKSWHYVNGDVKLENLKKILPHLPDTLKLPEHKEPTVKKDQ